MNNPLTALWMSKFVIRSWPCSQIGASPEAFVAFLTEAFNEGAKRTEIERLARRNRLNEFYPGWTEEVFVDG